MPHPTKVALLACLIAGVLCTTLGAAKAPDEAGVRDAENRWSEAFISGDTASLEALLDARYVSVNTKGHAHNKAEILKLAHDYAAAHPGEHAKPLASSSSIRVIGNSAIVQHHGDADTSVDVFYFKDGRWRAWYSQHSKLEG